MVLIEAKIVNVKCDFDGWTGDVCQVRPHIHGSKISIDKTDELKFLASNEEQLNSVQKVSLICGDYLDVIGELPSQSFQYSPI